jgi:hypothetical protein
MEHLNFCVLTGHTLTTMSSSDGEFITYTHQCPGKVKVSVDLVREHLLKGDDADKYPILAGLCRAAFEAGTEPLEITTQFKLAAVQSLSYPKTFKEKVPHLLRLLYDRGGKDFKPTDLNSAFDYPLCYAEDDLEFERIIQYMLDKYWLTYTKKMIWSLGVYRYQGILLTDSGIDEVEKALPKVPMISLVSQQISTGDFDIDEKINYAKKLFFNDPQTLNDMRSACETLSYVLEPLREDLKGVISAGDVEAFFQLVNKFDIRHNKAHTLNLKHPEQLEWVFYSLLNTINTYTKLGARLLTSK